MVKLAEWMYKGSTRQPKSSLSAGGGAAGNTLVLGCNGTLTEMQEMDFCKLQHTACNPSPLKEVLALLAISQSSSRQLQLHSQFLLLSGLQVQVLEQLKSTLFTFKRSAVFKHLRISIKNFAVKSIFQRALGLLSQTHSIMTTSCKSCYKTGKAA